MLAATLLPTSFGVAMTEPEVVTGWPAAASMLQHAAEKRQLEATKEEEEPAVGQRNTCGQTCSSLAPEHGASCAVPAAATQATQQTKESNSNAAMAQVRIDGDYQAEAAACSSDAVNWPLLLVGIGLLLAGQFDCWDRLLDGTEVWDRLPQGSLRKSLTVIGALAVAEGSTLVDARPFALSFAFTLTVVAVPHIVVYTRRDV